MGTSEQDKPVTNILGLTVEQATKPTRNDVWRAIEGAYEVWAGSNDIVENTMAFDQLMKVYDEWLN